MRTHQQNANNASRDIKRYRIELLHTGDKRAIQWADAKMGLPRASRARAPCRFRCIFHSRLCVRDRCERECPKVSQDDAGTHHLYPTRQWNKSSISSGGCAIRPAVTVTSVAQVEGRDKRLQS
jgi:hypothetical protein